VASSLKSASSKARTFTHEGAPTVKVGAKEELFRTISCCLLWENTFYEDGIAVADRIKSLVPAVKAEDVFDLAVYARTKLNLRHAPLMLARELARSEHSRPLLAALLPQIVLRADELAEFLAMYWSEGRCPIAHSVRRGLAKAFERFDEYALAKYSRDKDVKLRDVLRLVHPVPADDSRSQLYKKLKTDTLETPYTWEVELSKPGADKRQVWTDLINNKGLGAMAMLRNLRNMQEVKVADDLIRKGLTGMRTERVLPYRFISAARFAPKFEAELEKAMFQSIDAKEKLPGNTVLLVDVSGSMSDPLSAKSDMQRLDAASGLAILLREVCETVTVYKFNNDAELVPARRGFALRDAIGRANGGTCLGKATQTVMARETPDRLIIITDEQSSDPVPSCSNGLKGYIVNVGSNKNGVGYRSGWVHVGGWSEAIVNYITQYESLIDAR
jgi:hypothetical protein